MPRLELLSEVQRKMLQMFPCFDHDDSPWTPMRKPLSESRVALVTSAGLHLRDDAPFITDHKGGGDTSYRVIPRDTAAADIIQSHVSIGFDHTSIYRDINVTFPMDRLRELKDRGVIGSLADNYYSFMGALRDASGIVEQTGPEVAQRLVDEGVDVALLTPT
jgi:D-proline reductase (dithiol) PrdB